MTYFQELQAEFIHKGISLTLKKSEIFLHHKTEIRNLRDSSFKELHSYHFRVQRQDKCYYTSVITSIFIRIFKKMLVRFYDKEFYNFCTISRIYSLHEIGNCLLVSTRLLHKPNRG